MTGIVKRWGTETPMKALLLGDSAPPSGAAGGDLTGTYPNPTLAAAGPGATGPIGDATHSSAVTIDAKGRVTALSSVAITGTPPGGSAGGDLTGTYPNPTLAAAGPGATGPLGGATVAPIVTIDTKGRVTALSSTTIAGTVPGGSAGGDLTGTYPNPTLGTAGPGASGPIGDATHSAAVTIDAKGRVTGLSSVAITGTAPGGSAGGDLTGTYPNPTINTAAVTLAKMADLAQDQFIGRTTASTGVPQTATITSAARTVLDDTTVGAMVDTLGGASATGSGGLARATSPTFVTPLLGTPTSGTLTNCTGLPTAGLVDAAVTLAKMADLAQDKFIIRTTGSTGVPETATCTSAARTVLDDTTVGAMLDTLGGATHTGTGGVVCLNTPTLTTPVIGAATGTSLATTGIITSSSSSAASGYAAGAGSTVTQTGVSKANGVTINTPCGQITTNTAALAAGAEVKFTVTCSSCGADDVPVLAIKSGGTSGSYLICVGAVAASSFDIVLSNASAGSLSEAIVISYIIHKGQKA